MLVTRTDKVQERKEKTPPSLPCILSLDSGKAILSPQGILHFRKGNLVPQELHALRVDVSGSAQNGSRSALTRVVMFAMATSGQKVCFNDVKYVSECAVTWTFRWLRTSSTTPCTNQILLHQDIKANRDTVIKPTC